MTLMPGMIDLHCDALEKEVEPRPNVHFPLDFACAQADKRNATAGITTVFHALSFAHQELGVRNNDMAAAVARAVHAWQPHALVDNRVHCRYEITDPHGMPVLTELLAEGSAHLLSVMDHTPGQGQFKDIAAYRNYLKRAYQKSEQEVDDILECKLGAATEALERMQTLVRHAQQHGVSVASHDDDSAERVQAMDDLGIRISEFPVNLATAHAARDKGMATIFGAPNVVRGGSQSGSMRAIDAVREGVADCLCADYAPATLIAALYRLMDEAGISQADATRLVTANPARAAGLHDRGEIRTGLRADLLAVSRRGNQPHVEQVWVAGRPTLRLH
jgi:alpha-D-ribose 1-methylphosphonate 5-triphosphate diphosphatase